MTTIPYFLDKYSSKKIHVIKGDEENTYSYAQLLEDSTKFATYLSRTGIVKQDVFFFSVDFSYELFVAWTTCSLMGLKIVLLDPNYSEDLIQTLSMRIKPSLWLLEDESEQHATCRIINLSQISAVCKEQGLGDSFNGSLLDPSIMSFTSGTEARPKGIERKLSVYIDNANAFCDFLGLNLKDHVFLSFFPGYYLGGIYNNFIIPIVRGWNIVVPLGSKTGVLTNAWNYVLRYQVSIIWLVPSIVGILNRLGSSELTKQAALYVQYALSGTSQLSVVERENFFKLFGVDLLDNYSLSETLFISTDLPGIHGSVRGALMPYVDCCISQDSEVCVKSPYLLERYFHIDNSDASLVDNDDFFCTGDLGSLDLNRLTFTGRKKDLIIKGGVNISPAYIEEKFHEFSEISELTVVGVPDKYAGEIVVLYYVSEYNITEKIIEFSRANFSGPYIPDRTVRVDKLPKTSSGKIKKSTLRDKCNHV